MSAHCREDEDRGARDEEAVEPAGVFLGHAAVVIGHTTSKIDGTALIPRGGDAGPCCSRRTVSSNDCKLHLTLYSVKNYLQ